MLIIVSKYAWVSMTKQIYNTGLYEIPETVMSFLEEEKGFSK